MRLTLSAIIVSGLIVAAPAGAQSRGINGHAGGGFGHMGGGFGHMGEGFGHMGRGFGHGRGGSAFSGFSRFGGGFDSFRRGERFHNSFFNRRFFDNGFLGNGFIGSGFIGVPLTAWNLGGFYNPYDAYAYGGGYPPAGFTNVYGGYPPVERVYVERQVIITPPPPAGEQPGAPRREPDLDKGAPESGKGGVSGDASPRRPRDDFYLARPRPVETLAHALADIRRAWLNGDAGRLRDRIPDDATIRIFPDGRFKSTMAGTGFQQLVRDAIAKMQTRAFDFDPIPDAGGDRVFVSGRHSFVVPGNDPKQTATVYVSYALARREGLWRIVEAGSSSHPIHGHDE